MNFDSYIIGAGGHTRSLLALISHNENILITGIYDDSYQAERNEIIYDIPVKGLIKDIPESGKIILSYGDLNKREIFFEKYKNRMNETNIIHPKAFIEDKCKIGVSNQIFANVLINAYANIGNNNILNTGCIIEHEDVIGSHCHISIGAVLGGRVKIGDRVFVGAGATVIDKVSVCSDVIIGANSTVIKNITEPGTYVGSPARRIK